MLFLKLEIEIQIEIKNRLQPQNQQTNKQTTKNKKGGTKWKGVLKKCKKTFLNLISK
jgi:predicted transcriptional regulator